MRSRTPESQNLKYLAVFFPQTLFLKRSKGRSREEKKMNISNYPQEVQAFWDSVKKREVAVCPCCRRKAKVYKRALNSGMIRVLLKIARACSGRDWVHVHDIFQGGGQKHRDWPLLKHWNLVEPQTLRTGEKNSRGYWKLTDKGRDFLQGKIRVPSHVFVYNNTPVGFESKDVTAQEALGEPFNYFQVLNG